MIRSSKYPVCNDRTTGPTGPSLTKTLLIACALLIAPAVCLAGGGEQAHPGHAEAGDMEEGYGYHPYFKEFAHENPELFQNVPEHLREHLDLPESDGPQIAERGQAMQNDTRATIEKQMQEAQERMRRMMEEQQKQMEEQQKQMEEQQKQMKADSKSQGVVIQDDKNNSKIIVQSGENNRKNLIQKGENNEMGLFQTGKDNEGNISQSGKDNQALTIQSGKNNQSSISQSGSGNSATIVQGQ